MDMRRFTISDFRFTQRSPTSVAFMDANGISIRVENHRHSADGSCDRIDAELHTPGAQVGDGLLKVFDFQRGGAPVGARLETGRRADGECIWAEFVFSPL